MSRWIEGGINIAMKVPAHQYEATVAFYRDTLGLEPFTEKPGNVGFIHGPNRLWLDKVESYTQAEVWLELFTPDFAAAADELGAAGVVRNDAIEDLGEGFRGGWFFNPAGIVHLVREPDAW
jgi:catechol 2,3-dioxygenase-like lactoylglutathione lyase family enzyme